MSWIDCIPKPGNARAGPLLIFERYGHVPNHSGCSPAVQRHQAQPGIQQLARLQEGDQASVPQPWHRKKCRIWQGIPASPTWKRAKKKRVLLVIQKTITNMITRSFVTHFWKLISCKLPLFGQSRYKPHGLRGLGILGRWCKYVYVVQVEKPIIGGFFPWRRLQWQSESWDLWEF